ncbi:MULTISPECIES: UvrY/SirA/GacA family response regulator transcription factor [Hahella]|uniref:Response regulator containing a CheY-like receiver domain and an HTH DNA-binding domain n=1 Tax=Hahella chejuensis (strain KCTC 2396) TaxID=349521 RepID=Q2SF18_HAHCH|nr:MULTISPECIES: UvrY/SirA/GacA family response regulator transcription factor [Hahella]ABC30756.1 Response regulator containing a CheY-like receiver domain and an HTH DNA-binding domain [Hahella chejuensis KCTC 2396]AZZ91856.1 two-component system response regulator UvrY [Hahella sp. KA22]MBU6953301.1 UvrY/SirA/GacA family response regulator transcription factor [Hahella sp. HN01]MDG9670917.1 UvrY/SirA/GacA family response regulator transcription factor [Hahella sp. CR1]QAY55227.1 two-compone
MIRVLIVDDHELVRAGLSRMLKDEDGIEVVAEARSGEEAVSIVRQHPIDIILMDIRMPGIGGLEAMRRIHRIDESVKVVAVTACEDDPFPSRVMKAGASAYITKGADITEMVKAIRVVHAGQRYISPDIAQKMALRPFDAEEGDVFESLSEREMQIAMMIVNCHKVQEISDKLCLSPKTVNSYRYRIFEKLNINSDVELTLLAIRHGMLDANQVGSLKT